MFQDIAPHLFRVEYAKKDPSAHDLIFISRKDAVLMADNGGTPTLPDYAAVHKDFPQVLDDLVYLFSVDDTALFLSFSEAAEKDGYRYSPLFAFRELKPDWLAFAGATAFHLAGWYGTNKYCGRCATPMSHKEDERAMACPQCGNIVYPKIAPVVIVTITNGDNILLTRYAAGYTRYALVAGFVEIGETLEDAVRREIMEEVGLRVKNIRYYKSQPWAFSGSLLSGFVCDVDGDTTVTVDQKELSEAVWLHRSEIPLEAGSNMSLTWTMVEAFQKGEI